jgi:hypothetical protein
MKLLLLAAFGLVLGFTASASHRSADACSCLGFVPWQLTFVEASPDVDAAAWNVEGIYLNRSTDRDHSIHSNPHFELYMERK